MNNNLNTVYSYAIRYKNKDKNWCYEQSFDALEGARFVYDNILNMWDYVELVEYAKSSVVIDRYESE